MNAHTTIIKAFTIEQASRLSGLSVQRLISWDRSDFFAPSYASENRRVAYSRVYSFEDIVDLRTLAILRDRHNVQVDELRRSAARLKADGGRAWSGRKLYVFRGKVAFDDPENGQARNVVDGQYIETCIPLESIAKDMAKQSEEMRGRPSDSFGKIARSKFVAGNQWVVAGTRIPISAVLEYVSAGYKAEGIIEQFPDLTLEDVEAAVKHKAKAA